MLTISQLASYAGVTVRAVRHYHHIGLMPEPARDRSGYRTYGAADVVRLIRIRTLAEAGVPLARVQELLDATPAQFSEAVAEIDAELRARVRELQEHRRRIARLADGDSLAVPPEVTGYLDKLRASGASGAMVEGERDAWILMAARWPEKIPQLMGDKMAQLEDPRTVQLYRLIDELVEVGLDEDRLSAVADLMVEMIEELAERGELDRQNEELGDDAFIGLIDSYASEAHPVVERLRELLAERGWTGWSRMERAADPAVAQQSRPERVRRLSRPVR
jgi:DNA-binding transcriptional MerR regulator